MEARRVLLDALTALQPHIDAVVLIGAQAVYLRCEGRLPTYRPFTTDADLVIDPGRLADSPLLGDAMTAAGFVLPGEPGIWEQRFERAGFDGEVVVPVDLIVPAQLAPKAGRRGARLPRGHGKTAARKSDGVGSARHARQPNRVGLIVLDELRHTECAVAQDPGPLLPVRLVDAGFQLNEVVVDQGRGLGAVASRPAEGYDEGPGAPKSR